MTRKYNRGLLLFIINICILTFSNAQAIIPDSVVNVNVKSKQTGYGDQPSWIVTSAISSVSGNDLQKSFTSNLGNTLFGTVPGLTVMQNGNEPGQDSPSLYIRGLNTYGTGRSVLVIVDGIESSYEQLVPAEIESVSVLKDASATAIYGSRGANGVLLVTTRRGSKGQMVVNFSIKNGFTQAQRLPDFLGSYDYARLYNEALANNGKPAQFSQSDLEAYRSGSDPKFHPNVNWYNEVLKNSAPTSNYNLNFSGGSNMIRYFVLLNALTQDGLYKNTAKLSENSINQDYSRFNFRSNVDIDLTKNMTAAFTLGGAIENKTSPNENYSTNFFNLLASIPPNAFPVYNEDGTFGGNSLYSNPYGDILNKGLYTANSRTVQTSLKLTQNLDMVTKGLSVSGFVGFSSFYAGKSNKTRSYMRFSETKNEFGTIIKNKIGQNTSLAADEGMLSQWRNTSFQAYLNYDRTFGEHKLAAMTLFNNESYSLAGTALPFNYLGLGGRFTYAYLEKYIGEFSFAYNGSENFPQTNRWGLFPAVSLGWIASKEDFLKKNKVINFLKIKASYGLVGNDNIGGKRFMFNTQSYVYGGSVYFGSTNSSFLSVLEDQSSNPNVTWEKEQKLNIGFEATLFNNFEVSVDIFKNERYDILAKPYQTIPLYIGFYGFPDFNLGKTTNEGFEFGVRYNSNKAKDFQYFVEANVWYSKNKIVYNAESIKSENYLLTAGKKIDQPFMYESIGFFKDQEDINNSPTQIFSKIQPGDLKYKDQNHDGIIDQNDRVPIGNVGLPQLTIGLKTGVKFKGFDLNALIQGVTGRTVYLDGRYYQAFQNNGKISAIALGRWTPETATTATYPRLSATNDLNNFQPSSFWQRDGSFVKLRNVEFGYSLSTKLVKKIHLIATRFFVNGTNLFSMDHIAYSDPESLSGYPALRTYSIGASIQF